MKRAITAALLCGISVLASGHAWGQDSKSTEGDEAVAKDIVVTGSRVSSGANSPTPLTVLPTEQFLKLQPTTVTEAVNLLPALQGSQNVTSRPAGGQRNGAGAYMNLRNMGSLRTLVLWDSQRVVPTINQNQADVDASIVPQMLLKRADVVTGGVSAVYGSDAISGVINFVTDRDFNGVKMQANNGISTYGDNHIWDVGIAAGTRFANDRAHVEFSYQHHDDAGIMNRQSASDRGYLAGNVGQAGAGTVANPYYNINDMRLSNATFGGYIVGTSSSSAADAALRGLQFASTGNLATFNHGLIPLAGGTLAPFGTVGTLASSGVESGGDGAWFPTSSLKHGIRFDQAFGRFDYDLTDDIHAYAQVGWTKVFSFNQFRSPTFVSNTGSLRFSYANPFLRNVQEPYRSLFTNAANASKTFNMNIVLLNEPRSTQETESYMAYAGLDGSLGDKFKWEVNVGQSKSVIQANDLFNMQRGKLAAALDAVDVGLVTTGVANGNVACRATVAYAGHAANPNYNGCVPLNLFGGKPSQAALDWLYEETYNRNRSRLEHINGAVTGTPFDTWAGPVKVALSGEFRRLRWDVKTNTDPLALADCTGIVNNCTSTTALWFNNTMGAVPLATQKVSEGALEIEVPLLRDMPFAESFNITGAVRRTHYSTSGNATTWKLGADWQVNDDIRFRATRSRDIRAPNLFDLFTSTQVNCAINAVDKLTGTTYLNICNTQGSNPNLTPEVANTLTLGVVLTPNFVPGLSLTVDYYKIDVSDVILLQQGWNTGVLTYCADVKGAAPVCDLVSRKDWNDTSSATNPITAVRSANVNIAAQHTWGVDTELSYATELFGRPLSVRAMAAYQPKLVYDQGPSGKLSIAGAYNVGSNRLAASPKWKVTGVLSYDVTDSVNVTLMERWRSGLKASYDPSVILLEDKISPIGYTTLNVNYRLKDSKLGDADLFFNVQNLFNAFPKAYYSGQVTQPGTQPFLPEGDDTIGRYFTVGLRVKI